MRSTGPDQGRGLRELALVAALAMLAAACSRGSEGGSAAPADSRVVRFRSADGVLLEGRLFGSGGVGVVLSHMLPADQSSWYEFAERLAAEGYLALTYDFRGYCPGEDAGCSQGEKDIAAIWQDVVGAAEFLRSRGATRIMLVGASMGGTASLVAAARGGPLAAAIVTLSAPTSIEGLVADPSALQQIQAAKLFLAGALDATAAAAAQELYDQSPPPKRVEILPSSDHGTDLLTGNQAEAVRTLILNYLDKYSQTG
ncbi:MAG: alpha/beta hydrolase family protein [Actinomycetota bacterium]